jgi:hypothetical protein
MALEINYVSMCIFWAYLSLYGIVMQLLYLQSPRLVVEEASSIWQICRFHHTDIDSPLLYTTTKAVFGSGLEYAFFSPVAGTKTVVKVLDAEVLVAVGLDEEADEPPTSLAAYIELI